MMTMMTQKNAENFICEKCDFVCSKKSNYEKHLLTRKHKNDDKKEQKNAEQNVCICGKSFKYRQGLYVHRKTCIDYEKNVTNDGFILETEINKKIDSTTDKELKDLVKEL